MAEVLGDVGDAGPVGLRVSMAVAYPQCATPFFLPNACRARKSGLTPLGVLGYIF